MEHRQIPAREETLAGFRLIRRIGTGSRSIIYLGRAPGEQGQALNMALKVFGPDADRPALDRQVRATLTVPPAMLAPLRDVATAPDGRLCLVLDRLTGSSLDRLLAERGTLGAGEVVTIAATITAALQALHDAGFSHSMIGPACVRFDGRGRPVLLGLGALEDLPAGGAGVARRRDDLVRLAGCVRSICDHLDPQAPEAATAESVVAEFEAAATARPVPPDLSGVESVLFDWAAATAVRGAVPGTVPADPEGPEDTHGLAAPSSRLTRPARPAGAREPAIRARGRLAGAERGSAAKPTGRLEREVRRGLAGCRSGLRIVNARSRAGARWLQALLRNRSRARPVIVGVCLAVVLAAGGLAALSPAESPAESPVVAGDAGDLSAPATRSSPPGADATAGPGGDGPAGADGSAATLVSDDPAAATLVLLELREGCLAEASVLCLESADQAGSVAMAADSYQALQMEPSADRTAAGFTATVQERRGNAALIVLTPAAGGPANTQPASALVIKGEAGWRLRELFDY
ncbi:hypothetical protein C3B61_05060 [Cryobacterium zongtaii]|uniref:Protein kinase domain-containing protein n=1 Tax=Cryobacterium zongtaii TaxID=1259217 RepID=A0A2S3ZI83_9MICO|nr:hypothetical protein [Cryobacterium zongtaii]POH67308.1 hypothetical protein C3B61_05060 [Cryobacterium zongtaii]